jgi:hypothetical protein
MIGICGVRGAGGWQTGMTTSCGVNNSLATIVHNLYLRFTEGDSYLLLTATNSDAEGSKGMAVPELVIAALFPVLSFGPGKHRSLRQDSMYSSHSRISLILHR